MGERRHLGLLNEPEPRGESPGEGGPPDDLDEELRLGEGDAFDATGLTLRIPDELPSKHAVAFRIRGAV